MRFQLFDRIVNFEKGKSIAGVKNVTLESGNLTAINNRPFYPPTLCMEALAQLGGWCVSASRDFSLLVVLGMFTGAEIHRDIIIGDSLTLKVNLLEITEQRSVAKAEAWKDDALAVSIDRIVYGMFKIKEPRFVDEQEKFFYALRGN
jgi:3-hydroxymyristoyl/3-hydroxydecanoyl-(acyl carrier protein) dehydratase